MADVQSYFEQFNNAIRLGKFEENETLRAKRDIIQNKLWDNLPIRHYRKVIALNEL